MSLPSSPGGPPTLLEYFERSELRPPMLGSAPAVEQIVLRSTDDCEVRPLFHTSRSDTSATPSATETSDGQSVDRAAGTPGSSIWDAEERNSKLAGELVESIDAHIEDTECQSQCEGMNSSLADLMIAEIAAEIEALGSEDGDGDVEDATDVCKVDYEFEAPEPTMSDAEAQIQLFEESDDYFVYARDRAFQDQFSRRHPNIPLVRAEERMKVFEATDAWCRYLEALQVVVVGHEEMPELQIDLTRQAGNSEVWESAAVEDGSKCMQDSGIESRQRVKGQLSKQWESLGTKKRPIASVAGLGGQVGIGAYPVR